MEMSILDGREGDDLTEGLTENDYMQNNARLGMRIINNVSKTPVNMVFTSK